MADKEIINDVNVSECEFLWKEKLPKKVCNNGNLGCDCSSNLNCIFKQLKHKEQECEELNSDNRYFVDKIISLKSLTDKYELAFKGIEKIIDNGTADTQTNNAKWLQQYYLTRFWEISNIIDEVMGEE